MPSLLPLFPLDVVLFPGAALPLHIFEPRYKEMIGECLSAKAPFGIVRAKDSGMAEVGCTAEILEISKRYDDGRLDILTEGRRRFEIVTVSEERPFLQGEVMYFDDEVEASSPEQESQAIRLYGELLEMAGVEAEKPEPGTPQLSFHVVGPLPVDLDFKQTLLGMRSEKERIASVVEYYQALVPRMRRTLRVREKAGGNGHAM